MSYWLQANMIVRIFLFVLWLCFSTAFTISANAQADTNLKYLGRYFIQPDGKPFRRLAFNDSTNKSFTLQLPSASDTFVQRKVFLTQDSALFYADVRVAPVYQLYAKGFLLSKDSLGVRHGRSWILRGNGNIYGTGEYNKGKRQGDWLFYRLDGKLGGRVVYDRDSVVQQACFSYEEGRPQRDYQCQKHPTLLIGLDSLETIINSSLMKRKIKGDREFVLGLNVESNVYLDSITSFENEFIFLSKENKDNRQGKLVRSIAPYFKWTAPAFRNGVETSCWIYYKFDFKQEHDKPYSSVMIAIDQEFFREY